MCGESRAQSRSGLLCDFRPIFLQSVACRSLRVTSGRAKLRFAGMSSWLVRPKGEGIKMMRDTPLVTDMPRDKYVERCKQRALDYLDRGDIEKAVTSIITTMDARTDCKIPHYLITLGGSLLLANDALGLRLLIEDLI